MTERKGGSSSFALGRKKSATMLVMTTIKPLNQWRYRLGCKLKRGPNELCVEWGVRIPRGKKLLGGDTWACPDLPASTLLARSQDSGAMRPLASVL